MRFQTILWPTVLAFVVPLLLLPLLAAIDLVRRPDTVPLAWLSPVVLSSVLFLLPFALWTDQPLGPPTPNPAQPGTLVEVTNPLAHATLTMTAYGFVTTVLLAYALSLTFVRWARPLRGAELGERMPGWWATVLALCVGQVLLLLFTGPFSLYTTPLLTVALLCVAGLGRQGPAHIAHARRAVGGALMLTALATAATQVGLHFSMVAEVLTGATSLARLLWAFVLPYVVALAYIGALAPVARPKPHHVVVPGLLLHIPWLYALWRVASMP